jgi:hypothetical protein
MGGSAVIALIQSMNLPLVLQATGDASQIFQRAKQAMEKDQWRAFAGNAVIEFNTHGHDLLESPDRFV